MFDLEKINSKLKTQLPPSRYNHSLGVMYTSASLAMRYDENLDEAMVAGLLHDCGKGLNIDEQIEKCEKYGILLNNKDFEISGLIHTKLGAYLAEHEYEVKNKGILGAILCHATGRPNMTILEKIVYISDYIEPNRGDNWWTNDVRSVAFINIDYAVFKCTELKIYSLKEAGKKVNSDALKTLDFYKAKAKYEGHI